MDRFSQFLKQYGLATLWFGIAAFFVLLAALQLKLMLAPEGSDDWNHSEWAPAALLFCVVAGAPFALSGAALVRNWLWRKVWQFGPAILVLALVLSFARQI